VFPQLEATLDHPSIDILAKLLAGDLPHEDLLALVVPHLLELCPVCRERHAEILRLQKEVGHWDERVAVIEAREAPELLARLRKRPFDEQVSLVTNDESFHLWGLAQLLIQESLAAVSADATKATDFAELAVKVAQNLGEAYDPHWVLDLRARAYASLGQARRALGELRSAETALREAEALLARSMTGNPEVEAEVGALRTALGAAQRAPRSLA
jgi:hypothetical protein